MTTKRGSIRLEHAGRVAVQQLAKINPALPVLVAYEIVAAFEILEGFANRSGSDTLCLQARAVVERAKRQTPVSGETEAA